MRLNHKYCHHGRLMFNNLSPEDFNARLALVDIRLETKIAAEAAVQPRGQSRPVVRHPRQAVLVRPLPPRKRNPLRYLPVEQGFVQTPKNNRRQRVSRRAKPRSTLKTINMDPAKMRFRKNVPQSDRLSGNQGENDLLRQCRFAGKILLIPSASVLSNWLFRIAPKGGFLVAVSMCQLSLTGS